MSSSPSPGTSLWAKALLLVGVEQQSTSHKEKLISAVGAFLGILAVSLASHWYLDQQGALLMVASMGASAVLLFAVPHGALSQPWPVVAGHLVSASIGIACYKILGATVYTPALAVGLAVGAMYYLRCIHPPGGATALTAVIGGEAVHALGWGLMIYPIAINLLAILGVAIAFNSLFDWRRYPGHFAKRGEAASARPRSHSVVLTHEDFAAAMQDLNSMIDVTPDDLVELFERAAVHAEKHAEHPRHIAAGRYYSNGQLGQRWSVRQVIDAPSAVAKGDEKVIFKTVAGDGAYSTGICAAEEFRLWASFEVAPSNGHWVKVDKRTDAANDDPAGPKDAQNG